jgi:hypothetical protein
MIIIISIFLETSQLRGLEPMGYQQRARTNGRPAESARADERPHLHIGGREQCRELCRTGRRRPHHNDIAGGQLKELKLASAIQVPYIPGAIAL